MCWDSLQLQHFISPQLIRLWEEEAKAYGPGLSGALFGAGWWFWVDAVASSHKNVSFVEYLPGLVATLAVVMINAVRRDEMQEIDPFDEGVFCRSRLWLFLSYCVSFGAIIGAVIVLLQKYTLNPEVQNVWPGVAGIFQVTFVLGSALLFFISRTSGSASYGEYNSF